MNFRSLYILVDFSSYSSHQLELANQWCLWFDLEMIMVHRLEKIVPSLADPDLRLKMEYDMKREVQGQLEELRQANVNERVTVKFEMTTRPLVPFLNDISDANKLELIVVGLKGTGRLQQIFIGSTATKIIDDLNKITIALPKIKQGTDPKTLVVAVHDKYPVNENALNTLLNLVKNRVMEIKFISVITPREQKEETSKYLHELGQKFESIANCSIHQFEGEDAFSQIKSFFGKSENSFLVVQKGSRSFTDRILRKFLINELVYDGSIPLIVLPLGNYNEDKKANL